MMEASRREFLKTFGLLGSLLLLGGCQGFEVPQCQSNSQDKMRPAQIHSLAPAEYHLVRPLGDRVSVGQSHLLEVSFSTKYQGKVVDFPHSVKLFLDKMEVTKQTFFSSGCHVPSAALQPASRLGCDHAQHIIRGPLKTGKHTAAVHFKDVQGKDYRYNWTFYAALGNGLDSRNFCPEDRIVPYQISILSPAHNQTVLKHEEITFFVYIMAEETASPNSVRLLLDGQAFQTYWSQSSSLKKETYIFNHISAAELAVGKHTVKIQFQDKYGKAISYDWNFYIIQPVD